MTSADLIGNAHRARGGGVASAQVARELAILAAQDGVLDPGERAALVRVPMDTSARTYRDRFIASAKADGASRNPEVEAWRRVDKMFAAKVAAVREHARPGDLILWRSDQEVFPWNLMKSAYGPWQHVSVVLADGKLLDPYWPDGVTVSTVESAVAKSFHRIKASEMVVVRPAADLDEAALKAITRRAHELQGKAYALISPLDRAGDAMSCARAAWEVFKAAGVDLAPAEARMYPMVISPADFARNPVARIQADGSVTSTGTVAVQGGRPRTALGSVLAGMSTVAVRFPAAVAVASLFQEPVTRWMMNGMAAKAAPLAGAVAVREPSAVGRILGQLAPAGPLPVAYR